MNQATNQNSVIGHLIELRIRLTRCLIALFLGAIVCLIFSKEIYHLLQIPMLKTLPKGSNFISTSPFESYFTYFKISLLAGVFSVSPYLFYQIWMFVTPGLYRHESKKFVLMAIISAALFTGGALFGYFIVFPTGFYYVNLLLEDTAIQLMPKMSDYLSVAMTMLLAFGFSFELPLVIFLLGKIGIINYSQIKTLRRYVIVIIFIVAAILTGPDVISQCLLAIPLCLLYELGGFFLYLQAKKELKEKLEEESDD